MDATMFCNTSQFSLLCVFIQQDLEKKHCVYTSDMKKPLQTFTFIHKRHVGNLNFMFIHKSHEQIKSVGKSFIIPLG